MSRITYRDYLIRTAMNAAGSLTTAVMMALDMRHEEEAIRVLEYALNAVPDLAMYGNPNPNVVENRPESPQGDRT